MKKTWMVLGLAAAGMFWGLNATEARTKLTTLPPRETVRIDLSSGQQGLAEENRTINLVEGLNHVDFSWAGTLIDMNSIQIRALQTPGKVNVLSTSYPPNEQALFWDVYSEKSGPAEFRISYLINGFAKRTEYMATATRDEKHLDLECRVNLANQTGESYNVADIQLGKVFTYSEREMLNQQIRKMSAFRGADVPLSKTYKFNYNAGADVRYFYTFKNTSTDDKSFFGKDVMETGKARVYIKDSENSETFLGEDWSQPTPVGQENNLYLGLAKDVKCERVVYAQKREDVLFGHWWHDHLTVRWQLQNFKKETVTLNIEEPLDGGEWTFDPEQGVRLMEEIGERDEKKETAIDKSSVKVYRDSNGLLKADITIPPTGERKVKWNLYVDYTLRNRGF